MRQKIHIRLIGIAILAVLVTTCCMTVLYYSTYRAQVQKDLQVNTKLLEATGAFTQEEPLPETFLQDLAFEVTELRITWIDTDGTVLFDDTADESIMENHANRPEVIAAFEKGKGMAIRRSDTMDMDTFYCAVQLDDGRVLRVATEAKSIFSVFFSVLPAVILILFIIIVLCIVVAHFLSKQFLRPIQKIAENIEDTTDVSGYKELIPFLQKIRIQHENILMAAKVRQDFTANVSHELKTPLTAISGYAELIENHMVEPERETHFAKEIKRNADRLVVLINDIIRLSELDHGEDQIVYENLDLNEIVQNNLEMLRVNAQRSGISLCFEGEECAVRANRAMMDELIVNLCQNAIRYNNEGGKVEVKVTHEKGNPVLIVSDDGIGIPKEHQERIFERFYRVDKSRSKETGGTGLGLAIVKHIVALHDATISLNSEVGKGTTIRVEF